MKDELRKQMEAYRRATSERERRNIVNGVVILRRPRRQNYAEDEYDESTSFVEEDDINEQFPPHGKRGRYSAVFSDPQFGEIAARQAPPNPDGSRPTAEEFTHGWREVTKRVRRKRVLTNAELERAAAGPAEDDSEDGDLNGDLTDRNQRRDFY